MSSTILNPEAVPAHSALVLEIFYKNRPIGIRPEHTPFMIGRENSGIGLSVSGQYASRRHCTIEFQDGKFVLRDSSTNGTFVVLGRGPSFVVRGETTTLTGSGSFKLGQEFTEGDSEVILFKVTHQPKK